jgi:ATP-dependent DNA ligase
MLKRRESPYRTGRHRGDWWKWKIDPLTVDAVLIYAQKGKRQAFEPFHRLHIRSWRDGELVPFAKAYSGLTGRRDPRRRPVCAQQHDRNIRAGAKREAAARVRDRIRSDTKIDAAQVGCRGEISKDLEISRRQDDRASGFDRDYPRAVG